MCSSTILPIKRTAMSSPNQRNQRWLMRNLMVDSTDSPTDVHLASSSSVCCDTSPRVA